MLDTENNSRPVLGILNKIIIIQPDTISKRDSEYYQKISDGLVDVSSNFFPSEPLKIISE